MTRPLVFLFRLLTILLSLTQCLCLRNDQPFFTAPDSLNERQLNLEGTAPRSTLVAEIKVIVSPSLKSPSKILLSRRRAVRDTLIIGFGNTILPSLPLASSQTASTLETHQVFPSRLARRELNLTLSSVILDAFGPGSTKDEGKSLPIRAYPPVIKARMIVPQEITHAASADSRGTNPSAVPPRPTQAPNPSNSMVKSATSTTSVASTKSRSGPFSSAAPVPVLGRTSSTPPSPTETQAPRSVFQQIKSYYDPANRFNALAVLITIGMIITFLVSLVAIIKCVCHKKRFANKKDYPEGFPWVEGNKPARSNSQRQGLISTASFISTRNSVASSMQPSHVRHQPLEDGISPNVEYQLNELGSDIYGYSWAVRASEIDHDVSSPSDEMPSSASTDESSQPRSIEFRSEDDEWDSRSLDEGPCFVRGGQRVLLQDSKVFKLGTA